MEIGRRVIANFQMALSAVFNLQFSICDPPSIRWARESKEAAEMCQFQQTAACRGRLPEYNGRTHPIARTLGDIQRADTDQ